jgi:signal transduction histidine kinase
MKRPLHIYIVFGLCLVLVLGAMGWASFSVLRLDEESASARKQAILEENERLALWRMDSKLATLIGRENARPYYAYEPFYPAEKAYTRMFSKIETGEVLVPSPLLTEDNPQVLIHFQFKLGGLMTSPEVPRGNMLDIAESGYTTHERIEKAARRLSELKELLDRDVILAALPTEDQFIEPPVQIAQLSNQGLVEQAVQANQMAVANEDVQGRRNKKVQKQLNSLEWQARSRTTQQAATIANIYNNPKKPTRRVNVVVMQPIWIKDVLVLARRVWIDGAEYIQGAWLNWPAIERGLMTDIQNLLPQAKLVKVKADDPESTNRLAALPAKLLPGQLGATTVPGLSPMQISMIIAWGCVLLAALAVFGLLKGAVNLSERRGAFVSAVTHELRTPLTTFRMYAEMLVEGMVPDPAKRESYLRTLQAEAERLDHLVKNVLAYSRLERSREGGKIESKRLSSLMERLEDSLAERARQAGMRFSVELTEQMLAAQVRADQAAFERILFNLVDNASKYAATAENKDIHLTAEPDGKYMQIKVRDHGPGIGSDVVRRLFKPFSKSVEAAAESAPGVGLGLALSLRLARKMGGELKLDPDKTQGTCFILSLPFES